MAMTKEQSLREAIAREEAQLAEIAHRQDETENGWQHSRRSLPPWNHRLQFLLPLQYNLAPTYPPPPKEKSHYSVNYSAAGMMSSQGSG
jgi:hypothetical protein